MSDSQSVFVLALAGLAALGMMCGAALTGWRGWLKLKSDELAHAGRPGEVRDGPAVPAAAARIELADLKERIRKLEAIAAGVEL